MASQLSPAGMLLAGHHETGVMSIGSLSEAGLNALLTPWRFAEAAASTGPNLDKAQGYGAER